MKCDDYSYIVISGELLTSPYRRPKMDVGRKRSPYVKWQFVALRLRVCVCVCVPKLMYSNANGTNEVA